MSIKIRSAVVVMASVALLGILGVAQASASTSTSKDKPVKDQEHHSRMSKAAFWRNHKHESKTANAAPAKQTQAQKGQTKPAQLKTVSAKTTIGAQKQKHASASKVKKSPTGKTSAAAKPSQKTHNGQGSSFQ